MSSVQNATGRLLYTSGASKNHYSATKAGPEMYGSAANDSFWGDSAVRTKMFGGAGDDIYYLYSGLNSAAEGVDAGIDTISTWMSYTLPANFENLTVTGNGRYAFGNDLDNILKGASGEQTLDGGRGNDVLTGGTGADFFVLKASNGSDLITDFSADDTLRLDGYGFTSLATVKAAMTQVGADVRLDLGNGEFVILSNQTIASFTEEQFELSLDMSKLTLSFSDEFDQLSLWNGTSGTWESNYWWGADNGNSLEGNGEDQWYIDTDYAPTASANPFSVANGVLSITAKPAAAAIQPEISGFKYTSGMLTSFESHTQTYGYFEIRADMPDQKGMWPAFWLLPADASWPPELDVIEMFGQDSKTLVMTAHSNATGEHVQDRTVGHVADTSGFHRYGVLWGPEKIVWYFDGIAIAETETPSDMHKPMYMIVNLAVGGFAGEVAANFTSDSMKIDYIRAYTIDQAPGAVGAGATGTGVAPEPTAPGQPSEPVEPVAPVPDEPFSPETPSDPAGPGTPNTPADPGNPDTPVGPGPGKAAALADYFDAASYLAVNRDVAAAGLDPLVHYRSFGAAEGRDASVAFDTGLYLLHNPDVAASDMNPLDHFIDFGHAEGRASYRAVGKAIDADGFDAQFYLFENKDVAAANIDARTHYDTFGHAEGRDANALFDADYYLATNPDVAAAGVDPMTHYNTFGYAEGRDPSAAFDTSAYLAANGDVAAAHVNPLTHFLQFGLYEGRSIADPDALLA